MNNHRHHLDRLANTTRSAHLPSREGSVVPSGVIGATEVAIPRESEFEASTRQ